MLYIKNNTHRCLVKELIPEFCPDCSKRLIVHMKNSEWVCIHWLHFKYKDRFCITHSKTLRDICRNRKKKAANTVEKVKDKNERDCNNKTTLTILYLMGAIAVSIVSYVKYTS